MVRPATLEDIEQLLQLETHCFNYDRLSRRNFRHLLTKAHAQTLVETENNMIRGYATLLFNRKIPKARLYSFAVNEQFRRQGIASILLKAVENNAIEHSCTALRLETRLDNVPMQQLIEKQNYQKFATIVDYYDDHATALRYEKKLTSHTA